MIQDCIMEQKFYYKINTSKNIPNIFLMKIESDAQFIEEHPIIYDQMKLQSQNYTPTTIRDSFVINFQESN